MTISAKNRLSGRRVVIVRDRASAGGGIHAYYQAIEPHLRVEHEFLDVGRPHIHYGQATTASKILGRSTTLRLLWEWLGLVLKLLRFPDLVHLNPGLDIKTRRSLCRDAVNLRLAKLFRRPVLVFWRGWDNAACGTPEFPGGKSGWLCRTYRRADAHVVLARDFQQDFRRWNFSARIYVETTVVPDDVLAAGKARELSRDTVNLLFLSRIEIAKGVFELLDAFCLLQARQPGRYTLTFAGDGPALSELKERARDLGAENVVFPGFVTGEEKLACYRSADVFCFLSYTEGMPNAVLEAMAMGLPIVSSDAGGLKDILNLESGVFVRQLVGAPLRQRFSADEVADAIGSVVADRDRYHRISQRNRAFVEEGLSAAKVAARLEVIYTDVLASRALVSSRAQEALQLRT
jgi:glycosyltransferase involved in cell wall biosynthesis